MSLIPEETIEQVRDSADLIGLIGESVDLRKTGSDWRGPCPFHGGSHRNFAVIPRKQMYYCYVCHEAGDVFSFLMKRFGMDYPTAVREVARRSGILIPERTERAGPDPREPLFAAIAAAQSWFSRQLLDETGGKAALEYLVNRGLDRDTVAPLGLGFAPTGGGLMAHLGELGVSEAVALEAGLLVKRDDGRIIPRFRHRLLFPIHDLRGRPVGFGGRLLGPGEPKYLNSPETPIFHKGGMLYNLHQAKQAIRVEGKVIVVEGYFDVIRLVLAGIEHVVAPLGTALTGDQAALLRRFASEALLLYDSDEAGQKATFRAADVLLRAGVAVRVATMPDGEDPDTLVARGGAAALAPVLRDALDVLERKLQLLDRHGWLEGVEHRRRALDRLLPTIRAAAEPITRDLYVSLVAQRLGLSRDVLEREVAGARPAAEAGPPLRPPTGRSVLRVEPPRARRSGAQAEERLLEVLIRSPEWLERARGEVTPDLFEAPADRELVAALFAAPVDSAGQLPPALSELAAARWAALRERSEHLDGQPIGDIYEGALQLLRARPQFREISALTDPGEKKRRLEAFLQQDPDNQSRYDWWKAAQRSARRDPQP